MNDNMGLLINSSRRIIIYASKGTDYAEKAGRSVEKHVEMAES
jgi:hypothetical protein